MGTATAAFLFAATAIAVFVGVTLLFPGRLLHWLAQFNKPGMAAFETIGRWSSVFLLALGCGTFSAALAMLRARVWPWWFACEARPARSSEPPSRKELFQRG